MAVLGKYLYGFAEGGFQPGGELLGLASAPVHAIAYRDVAALVSDHPVEKLSLLRRNVEPHHRVIREISRQATFIPASFGHVSESPEQILEVLRDNYEGIRQELERLAGKVEMGIKLLWDVDNIFEFFVSSDRELRNRRDRLFGKSRVSLEEKLELGAFFEKRLKQERERLGGLLIEALRPLTIEVRANPPADEKVVLNAAFLIERVCEKRFEEVLYRAATLFDSNFALDYSGPWPPYSFIRLNLKIETAEAAALG